MVWMWIDPQGGHHVVTRILSRTDRYAYIQLADGSTINTRHSQLVEDQAPQAIKPRPRRYIDLPPPTPSPKRSKRDE